MNQSTGKLSKLLPIIPTELTFLCISEAILHLKKISNDEAGHFSSLVNNKLPNFHRDMYQRETTVCEITEK
jgi:hypothetical protein